MATAPEIFRSSSDGDDWDDRRFDDDSPHRPIRRPIRVGIVARRYYPHGSSETARRAVRLAGHLRDHGCIVRVATPRIRGGGPDDHFVHRDIRVSRVLPPPRSSWTSGRYVRLWTAWLIDSMPDVDVLLCVGGRDEAVAAMDAGSKLGAATVVWPTVMIGESDVAFWPTAVATRRYAGSLRRADRVVAGDETIAAMLVAAGLPNDRVEIIPPIGTDQTDDPSSVSRANRPIARRRLAAVNADLSTDPTTPVVCTDAAMIRGSGLEAFCDSLMAVAAAYPDARFWIIGDGPARSRIYNKLRGDGLGGVVAMPGTFQESVDVLAAADVFVHLASHPGTGWLGDAVSAGCRLVVRRTPDNEQAFRGGNPIDPPVQWADNNAPSVKSAIKSSLADWSRSTVDLDRSGGSGGFIESLGGPGSDPPGNWPALVRRLVHQRIASS